jgi:hypothetical protein
MFQSKVTGMLIGLVVPVVAAAHAAPLPSPALAQAQLRAVNDRFVNGVAIANDEHIDALAAQDFLLTSVNGDWIDRAQYIASRDKRTKDRVVSHDDVRVRLFGSVALLQGVFETTSYDAKTTRVRYTNVYHWKGKNWRLVSAQNTAMRQGVAKSQVVGVAPAIRQWEGEDAGGDDDVVLRVLNANYVRAFRDADVAWYNAHLSDDYTVTSSDGSLHDRAKALADFARPVFATSLRSFPVDNVRIRRFDDVALIHAENNFELKDGRKGVSRYTDIWRKQSSGRWQCIAAHITTKKAVG